MPYIHCNMFGTPPVGGEPPWLPYEPLVPWCVEGHEDLWVELDHVPVAVHTFRNQVVQVARTITPGRDGRGHLVVVSGLPGTGKSSLLHQCVHEFARGLEEPEGGSDGRPGTERQGGDPASWRGRDPSGAISIVPVTGVRNDGRDLESSSSGHMEPPELKTVISRIFRSILRELKTTPGFREAYGPEIDSSDHWGSWHAITDALAQLGRRLAVIIPHIQWADRVSRWAFLRFCHQKADRGVVFFIETEYTELEKEIGLIFNETQRRGVTHLKTGALAGRTGADICGCGWSFREFRTRRSPSMTICSTASRRPGSSSAFRNSRPFCVRRPTKHCRPTRPICGETTLFPGSTGSNRTRTTS